jgi:hypothetical protein
MNICVTIDTCYTNLVENQALVAFLAIDILMGTEQGKTGLVMIKFPNGYIIPFSGRVAGFTGYIQPVAMRTYQNILSRQRGKKAHS